MFCLSLNMQIFSLKENKFLINTDFESESKVFPVTCIHVYLNYARSWLFSHLQSSFKRQPVI